MYLFFGFVCLFGKMYICNIICKSKTCAKNVQCFDTDDVWEVGKFMHLNCVNPLFFLLFDKLLEKQLL